MSGRIPTYAIGVPLRRAFYPPSSLSAYRPAAHEDYVHRAAWTADGRRRLARQLDRSLELPLLPAGVGQREVVVLGTPLRDGMNFMSNCLAALALEYGYEAYIQYLRSRPFFVGVELDQMGWAKPGGQVFHCEQLGKQLGHLDLSQDTKMRRVPARYNNNADWVLSGETSHVSGYLSWWPARATLGMQLCE